MFLLKEWTTHSLSKVADAHFLVLVVELTHFLSIFVCWFWFRLSQTTCRKQSPEEMVLLV